MQWRQATELGSGGQSIGATIYTIELQYRINSYRIMYGDTVRDIHFQTLIRYVTELSVRASSSGNSPDVRRYGERGFGDDMDLNWICSSF